MKTNDIAATIFEWNLDEAVIIEPNITNPNVAEQTFRWTRCSGGEVRSLNYLMENEELCGEDTICLLLTITNAIAPN